MASSLGFYSGRVLPIVGSLLEVRKKMFGRREAISPRQIYGRVVQDLFSYGMQFSRDRDMVKDALVQLFVQISRGGPYYEARSIQISLFTQFRKMLKQVDSTSEVDASDEEHRAQAFEASMPQGIRTLTPLHQEVLFLVLTCGFDNREVAVIMDVRVKTVSQWADEAMESLCQQRMKVQS
jgi:DNA-directed RNA polymerase specialized sigma24 family protein